MIQLSLKYVISSRFQVASYVYIERVEVASVSMLSHRKIYSSPRPRPDHRFIQTRYISEKNLQRAGPFAQPRSVFILLACPTFHLRKIRNRNIQSIIVSLIFILSSKPTFQHLNRNIFLFPFINGKYVQIRKAFYFMRKGYWRSYRPIPLLYASIFVQSRPFFSSSLLKDFYNRNKYAKKGPSAYVLVGTYLFQSQHTK